MKSFEINLNEKKRTRFVKKDKTKGFPGEKATQKKKITKIISLSVLSILLVTGIFFGYKVYSRLRESGIILTPDGTLKNIFAKQEPELKKDNNEITTAMLIGIDTRPSQPGLQNTDSIMAISYNHQTQELVMVSIPRDTMVENPHNPGYFSKINSIYNLCENYEDDSGILCLKDSVSEIIDREIHYYGMIDISGLVELVDTLGGIEVTVENSFTDYAFPTPEGGWETVSFESGTQHMDGETAMKFARSRHSMSSEGSDFARARRQQLIIVAVKEKLLSLETYANPIKLFELIEDFGNSLTLSDLTSEDIRAGLNIAQEVDQNSVHSLVLDPSIANWTLITESSGEAYSLLPTSGYGDWDEINKYIDEYISNPNLFEEDANIYIYNGGLGYNETYELTNDLLEEFPYHQIIFGGNLLDQSFEGNSILDYTVGDKPETVKALEIFLNQDAKSEIPDNIQNLYGEEIIIIAGSEIDPTDQTETANQND